MINKIIWLLVIATCTSVNAEHLYKPEPPTLPKFAYVGKYQVGVSTLTLTKANSLSMTDFSSLQDRQLKVELWYPANVGTNTNKAVYQSVTRLHKPFTISGNAYRNAKKLTNKSFPLVVISHGYTGDRVLMYYLGEHLASHGYAVAAIDHTDSTTAEIDFKKAPFQGFVSTVYNRARDQQFVMDYLTNNHTEIENKAAVIGYSMGGYGAINTVGGCYNIKAKNLIGLGFAEQHANALYKLFSFCNAGENKVDSRWQAMIALAPWGQELNLHSSEALAQIKVPSLYISGDQDDISGYANGVKKLFEQNGSKDSFLLTYQHARHNIAPHPAPSIAYENEDDLGHFDEPSWSAEKLNYLNKHFSLVFLDCYLKQKTEYCEYLPNTGDISQQKQTDGKLTPAWKGFKDRWGTGVKFSRKK